MSKQRNFEPIAPVDDFDEEDRKIEALARREGVPQLRAEPKAEPAPSPKVDDGNVSVKKTIDFPGYVSDALDLLAATSKPRTTIRGILLKALHDSGTIEIKEADLVGDRRRTKGRGA